MVSWVSGGGTYDSSMRVALEAAVALTGGAAALAVGVESALLTTLKTVVRARYE